MDRIDYSDLLTTRDYIQGVAKIIGKIQQLFLPVGEHDEQHGLEITDCGLASQSFLLSGKQTQLELDLLDGQIKADDQTWPLPGRTPGQILDLMTTWLLQQKGNKQIEKPIFSTQNQGYDKVQATALTGLLCWANEQLINVQQTLPASQTTPVLLYPHHFDVAFSWFPKSNQQYSCGFSTGDGVIPEPYFYLTQYPETADFKVRQLPKPATWHKQGFSGAVLRYNELIAQSNPDLVTREFLKTLQS